jgi:hypothetical protein
MSSTRLYTFSGATGVATTPYHISSGEEGVSAPGSQYPCLNAPAIANTRTDLPGLEMVTADESCWLDLWFKDGWVGPHEYYAEVLYASPTLGDLDGNPARIEGAEAQTPFDVAIFDGGHLDNHIALLSTDYNGVNSSCATGILHAGDTGDVVVPDLGGTLHIWRNVLVGTMLHHTADIGTDGLSHDQEPTSSPALANLDLDADLEIAVGSTNGRLYAFNYDGTPLTGWSGGVLLDGSPITGSPIVGELDGDISDYEIAVGTNAGNIYVFHANGTPVAGFPKTCNVWWGTNRIRSAPVIDDVDGDGKVELIVSGSRAIFKFDLDATYNVSRMPWPTFHKNNARTGHVN